MRLQGIGDPASVSKAELNTYLALVKGPDRGRAFLQIMRSSERTAGKQARYRAAVRDVPYPVQGIWAADDPTMTLAVYGEKARAAAGLPSLHLLPGQALPSGGPGARHRPEDSRTGSPSAVRQPAVMNTWVRCLSQHVAAELREDF